ncbi:MAG: DUF3616 domain-containing protein, partial [Verrucomicrobia bacterium]|nr:DUF3616 domain-containing protein [Verrucomicrobiota bacterium]
GLAAAPDNRLLIAFRNPVPQGRALLIPLLNPERLIAGEKARFGDPILLELGGLGIRDIAFVEGRYLIGAGAYAGGRGEARLFLWDGKAPRPEIVRAVDLRRFNPEAIVVYPAPATREVQILSDDGSGRIAGADCRELKDDNAKRFRALWISLGAP